MNGCLTPAERPAFVFRVKDEAAYRRGDNIKEIAFHDQSRNENRSLTISKCNSALLLMVVNSKEGDETAMLVTKVCYYYRGFKNQVAQNLREGGSKLPKGWIKTSV